LISPLESIIRSAKFLARVTRRGEPTFADLFAHLALGPKLLVGQVLYLLMVVIGLLLLVVPGVYLSVRFLHRRR